MADETTPETALVEDETTTETTDVDAPIEGEEALGDPGKKALDTMKAKLREAEKAAREERARREALEQAAALRDKPAEEQAIEQARAEARAEALKAANERVLRSELRAAATGKLADPADAALYINLSEFTVSDDGDVDSEALSDAIADLIERKPHLAAVKKSRFDGAADQGAKGREQTPRQLSADDLSRMTPEQIVEAEAKGQLAALKGVKI